MFRVFARFTAQHPEFHQLVSLEAHLKSERFDGLLETYIRPYYQISTPAIRAGQAAGAVRQAGPGRLRYAVVGIISSSIVFANEYSLMTGLDQSVNQLAHLQACRAAGRPLERDLTNPYADPRCGRSVDRRALAPESILRLLRSRPRVESLCCIRLLHDLSNFMDSSLRFPVHEGSFFVNGM